MVRWKAGALLIGVALLLVGFAGMVTRQAEIGDSRRRSLELTASLSAARLDAGIAKAATALSIANSDTDLERLAGALALSVCAASAADVVACANPPGESSAAGVDATNVEPAVYAAYQTAGEMARTSGRFAASAASLGEDRPARAVVVAVDHPERTLFAVVSLTGADIVPASVIDVTDDDSFAAPLEIELGGERWWARVSDSGRSGLGARARLTIAIELALGALLIGVAIVTFARDHRGLRRRATIDALTGLPNRTEFERRASQALARLDREGRGACLIVVDLDRFKSINDTIGHAAGDRVLRHAGSRLANAVRGSDLVGRWGGDEFVALLGGIDDPRAIPDRAAALAACLADIPTADGAGLTASVGAAMFPRHGRDLTALLDVADRAMYEAKSSTAAKSTTAEVRALRSSG